MAFTTSLATAAFDKESEALSQNDDASFDRRTLLFYGECLKNHAASRGGLALDGCGEFMPSHPASFKCAVCGCHRNFHRREAEDCFSPNHHFCLCSSIPPPLQRRSSPSSSTSPYSPTPIAVSHFPLTHYASRYNTTLTISSSGGGTGEPENPDGKKRVRTKLSREQKEKMCLFADKLGWKMQKCRERSVEDFCNEIGIGKRVLQVWMHNNKHAMRKEEKA